MKIKHKLKIRSTREANIVKCVEIATKILLNELNITNIILTCQRQTGWAGSNAHHAGYYDHYSEIPTIKVNFRNLSGFPVSEYINVVGHECRHAYQYHNNLMNRNGWNGKELEQNDIKNDSYRNSPWEIDARNFERSYSEFVYNHPDFKECLQYLDLIVGDKEIIEDREAGLKRINSDGSPVMIFETNENILYWMNLSQVSTRAKKWSTKLCKEVWIKHDNTLYSQPFTKIMRSITRQDFV